MTSAGHVLTAFHTCSGRFHTKACHGKKSNRRRDHTNRATTIRLHLRGINSSERNIDERLTQNSRPFDILHQGYSPTEQLRREQQRPSFLHRLLDLTVHPYRSNRYSRGGGVTKNTV